MNKENKQKEIVKEIPEAPINLHELSKPTVTDKHKWIQRGTHICCDSCQTPHGFYVNVEDMLTGINEDGSPIITKKY